MSSIKSTRCARGHKMSGENLYIRKDNGKRQCRRCREISDRNRKKKTKIPEIL